MTNPTPIRKHGDPNPTVPLDVFLSDDPDLALAHANTHTWYLAHDNNCQCNGLCQCNPPPTPPRGAPTP
jgi:hypothetical protein